MRSCSSGCAPLRLPAPPPTPPTQIRACLASQLAQCLHLPPPGFQRLSQCRLALLAPPTPLSLSLSLVPLLLGRRPVARRRCCCPAATSSSCKLGLKLGHPRPTRRRLLCAPLLPLLLLLLLLLLCLLLLLLLVLCLLRRLQRHPQLLALKLQLLCTLRRAAHGALQRGHPRSQRPYLLLLLLLLPVPLLLLLPPLLLLLLLPPLLLLLLLLPLLLLLLRRRRRRRRGSSQRALRGRGARRQRRPVRRSISEGLMRLGQLTSCGVQQSCVDGLLLLLLL